MRVFLFLMHRVELKVQFGYDCVITAFEFLMHRVELKDLPSSSSSNRTYAVPNAPCGVERSVRRRDSDSVSGFLMHRVELKDKFNALGFYAFVFVPNAPCGVERRIVRKCLILVFYKLYDALGGAHII